MSPERREALNANVRLELDQILPKVGIDSLQESGGRILAVGVYMLANDPAVSREEAIEGFCSVYDKARAAVAKLEELEAFQAEQD